MESAIQKALDWFQNIKVLVPEKEVCASRDVFQGRLDHLLRWLSQTTKKEAETSLFTATIGELGNNCFDHNLGQWQDVTGCWFSYGSETNNAWCIMADRGQGVFSSLRRAVPKIKNDEEALEIAFHQKISGRAPERRGNGLKFVRSVINGNPSRGLLFSSGKAIKTFGGLQKEIEKTFKTTGKKIAGKGTFAFVLFKL